MALLIEDYALIGDCHTAALIGRNGSIDWLCLPRFDSGACFAALLGSPEHGHWVISPVVPTYKTSRRYREGTLVLETDIETDTGGVNVIDCMPLRSQRPNLVRLVVGRHGFVEMQTTIVIRFDYGSIVPWVRRVQDGVIATAGPEMAHLRTPIELHGENFKTVGKFTIQEGQRVPFVLSWQPSYESPAETIEPEAAIHSTEQWWKEWSGHCKYQGEWKEAVLRSLITLKALTYAPTGGIVAAVTTSLPELLRGTRNWDYRYCWVRDATFTLYALVMGGYKDEARAWRKWLLRAVAGTPSQLNIMYGLAGERRLTELELNWLPGYENSTPVRTGNAAWQECQLDVFGEVVDSLHLARRSGLEPNENAWRVQCALLEYLESEWHNKDEGIWEVRGPKQHFTHSKVMAWVAVDRMVKSVEQFGMVGSVERWRTLRDLIHKEVCSKGFDSELNSFVQYFGGKDLDASLLMIPLVGFLPPTDARIHGTVAAIERHLMTEGFVSRYSTASGVDGLPSGEGAFLPCTFWLADNLALMGRTSDARRVFERALAVRSDLGLLSEEYDPIAKRLLGNFPQAFSHVGLINTAWNLSQTIGPAVHRQSS